MNLLSNLLSQARSLPPLADTLQAAMPTPPEPVNSLTSLIEGAARAAPAERVPLADSGFAGHADTAPMHSLQNLFAPDAGPSGCDVLSEVASDMRQRMPHQWQ